MRKALMAAVSALALVSSAAAAQQPGAAAGLRIVVIEGEDAVNIIQQKTAVAPIVEVRDRNNLPVSGVAVTFSIGGQGATFGGASTLTVVTNAAGQATAAGLTPTATGALQISATATFQGQTAVATIVQSNVMTAAEVAGASGAAGGGSAGGGGGAGAGAGGAGGAAGGLSGAMIGVIGGVAAAGGLVAAQAGGGNDAPAATTTTPSGSTATTGTSTTTTPTTPAPPTQAPTSSSFTGPMDGTLTGTSTWTFIDEPGFSCSVSVRNTGTANMRLQTASSGAITGTLEMNGNQAVSAANCGEATGLIPDAPFVMTANVEGSGNTVRFTQEFRDSQTFPDVGSFTSVATISFTGTISGGSVSGGLTYNSTVDLRGDGFSGRATMTGTINITLR
jgi:hypothetical protein